MTTATNTLRELFRSSPERVIVTCCPKEEAANSAVHAAGLVLSLAALFLMVRAALAGGSTTQLVGCTIYGITLALVYAASASYHACSSSNWKPRLRTFDHICIYLLIAGTYTPFMLTFMAGPVGYTVLAVVWALAAAGIFLKLFYTGHYDGLSTLAYVAMGWVILPALPTMLATFPTGATVWMLVGGFFYTAGIIPYRLDHRVKYFHTLWHLFVIAGSAAQFVAVWKYVLAPAHS